MRISIMGRRLVVSTALVFVVLGSLLLPVVLGLNLTPAGATLDSGVVLVIGSSNATLAQSVVTSDLAFTSTRADFAATIPPTYLLNWPYLWNSTYLRVSDTPIAQSAALTMSNLNFASGIKIYSASVKLVSVSWIPVYKRLTVMTSSANTITVYSAMEGEPENVNIDGVSQPEGVGWSWNSTSRVATISFTSIAIISYSTASSASGWMGMLANGQIIPASLYWYTYTLGPFAYAIIVLGIGVAIYVKTGNLFMIAALLLLAGAILGAGVFANFVPVQAQGVVYALIALGFAAVIYRLLRGQF